MVNTTSNTAPLLNAAQVSDLFLAPLISLSVAAAVAEQVTISTFQYRIPRITGDPSAGFVAEGAEIPLSDATVDEVVVTPAKLAGLVALTSEAASDSNPAAADAIGAGLARDCARRLDAAFFGNIAGGIAPKGLGSLTGAGGASVVSAGGAWTNVDVFQDAIFAAASKNATITSWVSNPADALALSKVKQATGSNQALLQPDATQAGRRLIAGVPLYVSTDVPAGVVYGIPRDRAVLVIRDDVQIESDASAFWTSDRIALRARMRVGFAYPQPSAIVRVTKA